MNEGKETNAERAIKLLKERGALRTRGIADALGLPISDVGVYMRKLEETGAVVSCEVAVPGTPPQKEWRLSAGGKPVPFRQARKSRAPVPAPKSETQEAPAEARRTAPIERRKPVGKLITGEAARAMAQGASKPARKPRKAPKPVPAHPRGAGRRKATGKLLRAAAEGRSKAAKRLPVAEVPWKAEQPSGGFRCGIFNDGSLELVFGNGEFISLSPADTRVLFDYLDKTLQVAA